MSTSANKMITAHLTGHDEVAEDEFIESLAHEGDEDAVLVADFEIAATEVVQADEDLAAARSFVHLSGSQTQEYQSSGFWPSPKVPKASQKADHHGLTGRRFSSGS